MSFYKDASLVFLPSGGAGKDTKAYSIKPTDGSGDFTFSRGSNLTATRVDSNGLIEKGRENLLLQSNQFDTTWGTPKTDVTSGQSGYDGSSDAWLLEADIAGSSANMNQAVSISGVMTASIYAKEGTTNWFRFSINDSGVNTRAWFDLSGSGAVGTTAGNIIDTKIESVGNGYFRCSITFNATAANLYIFIANADNSISYSVGDNIYIQDAQLEQGLVATEYIESGASTGKAGILEDSPRFDYSGGASCPSLLLEPSRTQLVTFSEYFEASDWDTAPNGVAISADVTTNYAISPQGIQNATRLRLDLNGGTTNNDRSRIKADFGIGTSGSQAHSIYIKSNDGVTQNITFRSLGTSTNHEITSDWKRIDLVSTDNSLYFELGIYGNTSYNDTADLLIWGAQIEEASYPTSYIPNHSGGSVTREADSCSGAGDTSTFNDDEGVLYAEIEALGNENTQRWLSISDGSNNNTIQLGFLNSANNYKIAGTIRLGGNFQAFLAYDLGAVAPSFKKCAIKYKRNDFALWVDGVEVATDTNGSTYPLNTLNSLNFTRGDSVQPLQGNVKQVLYFPSLLTDTELTTLTS